ncbi:exosortase H-associated membrane protein [Candidatus Zixiibacteriota bacterium]
MASGKKPGLGLFWLKLVGAYIIFIALWPWIRPHYDVFLGRLTAIVVPLLAVAETTVNRIELTDELWFYMNFRPGESQPPYNLKYHLDPHQYGYGHIMFAALALAVPGWSIKKRLLLWLVGAVILQAFFVFMVLLNLFSTVGSQGHPAWPGDYLTAILPGDLYMKYRSFLSLVSAQFVPILIWLGLFVFSARKSVFWSGVKRDRPQARAK